MTEKKDFAYIVKLLSNIDDISKKLRSEKKEQEYSVPTFDTSAFERKIQPPTGYLTPEGRTILQKEPQNRTEGDLDVVEEEIQQMEFFCRFPYNLLRQLSKVLRYEEYASRQLILRDGQESFNMYIIVAGVVIVFKEVRSLKTGRCRTIKLEELSHGMHFGADDLLHRKRRNNNFSCKTPTQLLVLGTHDFDILLKDLLLQDEMLIEKNLRSIHTLAEFEWQEEDYEELKKCTKLGKFPAHMIIMGGTTELPYYVHFIVLGECAIEQEIEFVVEHNLGYNRLKPVPTQFDTGSDPPKVFKKRLEICQLVQGHYFGIGEDMSHRYVRSLELVETLMLPRHVLLAKQPKIFDKLKEQFEQTFPPLQQILDKYLEVLNWEKFKKKVSRQVSGDNPITESSSDHKPAFVKYF